MECEFCGEDACVALAVVEKKDGTHRELQLCKSCAKKLAFFFPSNAPLPFLEENDEKDKIACPACGTTLRYFEKNEIVGCPHCYVFFREKIFSIMENAKITLPFEGELPKNFRENLLLQEDADELAQKLQVAVERKDYEHAAFFRDELKKISAMRFGDSQDKQ